MCEINFRMGSGFFQKNLVFVKETFFGCGMLTTGFGYISFKVVEIINENVCVKLELLII